MSKSAFEEKREIISLATRLNALLKEKNIQKKELYSFCPQNNVTRWCNEKNPPNPDRIINTEALEKISEFLDVDVDYLLCKQVKKRRDFSNTDDDLNDSEQLSEIAEEVEIFQICRILNPFLDFIGNYRIASKNVSTDYITKQYQSIERIDEGRFYLVTQTVEIPVKGENRFTISKVINGSDIYDSMKKEDAQLVYESEVSKEDFSCFLGFLKSHILCEIDNLTGIETNFKHDEYKRELLNQNRHPRQRKEETM